MSEPAPPAIKLTGAAAERGGRAIWSQGNFEVPAGEVVGVIGPNGSGKTTLLLMLLGLIEPSTGGLEVLGEPAAGGHAEIGYVPQNYAAGAGGAIRCRDLVLLGVTGHRWGMRRASAEEYASAERSLTAVGGEDLADRRLSELSGGQQQRVAIAQALASEPKMILLDEPLANLDVKNQRDVVHLLGKIVKDRPGTTLVIVAHDLNPLLPILTSAVYLIDGHPHYAPIDESVDEHLLAHLYGSHLKVVKTAKGDLFTSSEE